MPQRAPAGFAPGGGAATGAEADPARNERSIVSFGSTETGWSRQSQGEVGLGTRNIKIQASADAEQTFLGGHIMAMPSSKMYVSGVELNRMGQHMTLARYSAL